MSNRIVCIVKDDRKNPYERITEVGVVNSNGRFTWPQQKVVNFIDQGYPFYVEENGHRVKVIVSTSRFGNKYIRTEADKDTPDNLLSLKSCPLAA